MILSVHLAHVGGRAALRALRSPLRPQEVPGLRWAEATAPLAIGHVPPRPLLTSTGLIAAWEDDAALDAFLTDHPRAAALAGGLAVRLAPLSASGSWAALPELADLRGSASPQEAVGVLTLGRLRLSQAARFVRATARAERTLLSEPALLLSVGLARPPFLATFSLWRDLAGMQDYAYRAGGGHAEVSAAHHVEPFHSEAAFVRLRPTRSTGTWRGGSPLVGPRDAGGARR